MGDVFRWHRCHSLDEMEAFYRSIIPTMRDAARECGYALGVHGTLRRDLDIIAAPWVEDHVDRHDLARELQLAACGLSMETYQWERKPCGRFAVSFPVCWVEFADRRPSTGHVDLSVMPRGA